MIYAIYINGVYKRCSEGDNKSQALQAALDKGMHLLIRDKVELLETKIGETNENQNRSC